MSGPIGKSYLGDSVYAECLPDGTVTLTTENGFGPSNTIVLEPSVLTALGLYVERMHETLRQADRQAGPNGGF